MSPERTEPPSGAEPPAAAETADGTAVDLVALATRTCERYDAEFPDERERYGPAGMAWCEHDNRYILDWVLADQRRELDLDHQLAWLAGILARRDFPLERLARDLELAAAVFAAAHPADPEPAARLETAAERLRRDVAAGTYMADKGSQRP